MHEERTGTMDGAFRRLRAELEIRTEFPAAVLREAERASERTPAASPSRPDRTDILFVTIDPPGSRDLDQAVHVERSEGGYRVRYAVADVGFWVDRGSVVEREAWLRGVTFYAPDRREPLYPPVLSQGVASLLPDQICPAVVFDVVLDERAELRSWSVGRALVRSRAQLTYRLLLEHATHPGTSPLRSEPWAETLSLLAEIGPKRLEREVERGGVSLPVRDQHVQRATAAALGYELVYEDPNEAEEWNAQISLLTGHVAALRMLEARVGLLRTMPAFDEENVEKFRRIARTLGFGWPGGRYYVEFMHRLDLGHPKIEALVRQARQVMRGASYTAFSGQPPDEPLHGALAFAYAHATAPLRRLADRYVLDLLVTLSGGDQPTRAEVDILRDLPPVMAVAKRKESRLERGAVNIAEAWTLRDRVGETFAAVAVHVRGDDEVEVQIEEPPIRTVVEAGDSRVPPLGAGVLVRLTDVQPEEGRLRFDLLPGAPPGSRPEHTARPMTPKETL